MQIHRIQKCSLECEVDRPEEASRQQNKLSSWVKGGYFQFQLESLFDSLVNEQEYFIIDELEINVNGVNESSFQISFLAAIKKAIEDKRLKKHVVNSHNATKLNKKDKLLKCLIYFLKHGIFPWDTNPILLQDIKYKLIHLPLDEEPLLLDQIVKVARVDIRIWQRLIVIIGIEGIEVLLSSRMNYSRSFIEKIRNFLNEQFVEYSKNNQNTLHTEKELKQKFWLEVLGMISQKKSEEFIVDSFQKQKLRNVALALESDNEATSNVSYLEKDDTVDEIEKILREGHFIQNAGLVILWTALGRLFKELKLVEGKDFVSKKARQQALFILHYLVYDDQEVWEYDLFLNKILCGWPLDEPVNIHVKIDIKWKETADKILENLASSWMENKKFSPSWLRLNFLQREGKIFLRPDGNWQIKVERKTEDILLNKLPPGWSYGFVMFTWMKKMLFVEWN